MDDVNENLESMRLAALAAREELIQEAVRQGWTREHMEAFLDALVMHPDQVMREYKGGEGVN